MNKIAHTLLLLLMASNLVGQELKQSEINRIGRLGLNYAELNNSNVNNNGLKEILEKERKRKKNKTWGYIIGGSGLTSMAAGTLMLTQKSADQEQGVHPIAQVLWGAAVVSGIIQMGVSIPFFTSASKRKKERDKLILEMNP